MKASIADRLSFATQKLAEIVKAAKDAPTLKDDQIKAGLPDVGMPLLCSPAPYHSADQDPRFPHIIHWLIPSDTR